MKTFLTAVLIGLANVLAINVLKNLEGRGVNEVMAILLSASAAVVFSKAMDQLVFELPLKVGPLRARLDPRAAMEGTWLETIPNLPDNPYTLLTIAYNPVTKSYQITGRNFDRSRTQKRSFEGQHVSISPALDQVVYTFVANQAAERRSDAVGICYMGFQRGSAGSYERGDGYFFNRDPEAVRFDFSFQRVTPKRGEADDRFLARVLPGSLPPVDAAR